MSKYDKEIEPDVENLFKKLKEKTYLFQKNNVEFVYDGREKCWIKNVFKQLEFAKQESNDAADYRIYVNGKLLNPFERKTWIDQAGSIKGRSKEQHIKMKNIPIPHHRKYYLMERVSDDEWDEYQEKLRLE